MTIQVGLSSASLVTMLRLASILFRSHREGINVSNWRIVLPVIGQVSGWLTIVAAMIGLLIIRLVLKTALRLLFIGLVVAAWWWLGPWFARH